MSIWFPQITTRSSRRADPVPGALARAGTGGVGPFTWPSRVLPNADSLRALVLTVITNVHAPVAVRNTCHHLMVAIEQNNQTLVDEILVSLAHVADRTGYLLPPLAASPCLRDDRAPSCLGHRSLAHSNAVRSSAVTDVTIDRHPGGIRGGPSMLHSGQ